MPKEIKKDQFKCMIFSQNEMPTTNFYFKIRIVNLKPSTSLSSGSIIENRAAEKV